MMLHQDGSRHVWLAGQPAMDLIVTLDDATSRIYSAFLVPEEGVERQLAWPVVLPHRRMLPTCLIGDVTRTSPACAA